MSSFFVVADDSSSGFFDDRSFLLLPIEMLGYSSPIVFAGQSLAIPEGDGVALEREEQEDSPVTDMRGEVLLEGGLVELGGELADVAVDILVDLAEHRDDDLVGKVIFVSMAVVLRVLREVAFHEEGNDIGGLVNVVRFFGIEDGDRERLDIFLVDLLQKDVAHVVRAFESFRFFIERGDVLDSDDTIVLVGLEGFRPVLVASDREARDCWTLSKGCLEIFLRHDRSCLSVDDRLWLIDVHGLLSLLK